MDLRIKTPDKRVRAFYDRECEEGGIALSVYDETMTGRAICSLGYDEARKKMVLLVNAENAKTENVEIVFTKNGEAGKWEEDPALAAACSAAK